nr:MAG: replication associated protein [Cressdnaviricota sp.]
MSRTRVWCFTSFAETEPNYDADTTVYQIYQREKCPETGREHWQGMVRFKHPRLRNGVKQYLGDPSTHLEPCRNEEQSKNYCQKLDTRIGEPHILGDMEQNDTWWQTLSDIDLWQNHSEWMLKHHSGVKAYRKAVFARETERPKPEVWIFIGEPGTGKSYTARQLGPYFAKASGPWWDGYNGESNIIFDDFYGGEQYTDLLRWMSELPIRVPIKGDTVPLKATTFIFTSNQHPMFWYKNVPDKGAFRRRVTKFYEFFVDHITKLQTKNIT